LMNHQPARRRIVQMELSAALTAGRSATLIARNHVRHRPS
jgi:hypothetical protein